MADFDNDVPPVLEPAPAPAPLPPQSSLAARLLNVFALPGRVFDEVRQSRHAAGNWLVPALLCSVALALAGYVMLSIPSVWKQIETQQLKVRETQQTALAESVKAGKITQAEADESLKVFDFVARPEVLKSAAAIGGAVFGMVRVFWWGFVLWFLARVFLRQPVPYGKALEVAGLAAMVALLSTVVMLALTVNIGDSFSASGFTLSVTDLASAGSRNLTAVVLNLMNFWLIMVLGIGLARLTGQIWIRGAFVVFGYWLLSDLLLLLLGVGLAGA
jgi:hypothetical protein